MKRYFCLLAALLMLTCIVPSGAEESIPKEGSAMGEDGLIFPDGWDTDDNARVFYEIFVGSFSDSDGDGTGDLRGIIGRMDYLNDGDPLSGKSLGVDGIWLTPVFVSPSYHKYDVSDYYTIDPAFGTMDDLRELAALCHERGVKLILDLPLNHTGSSHPWFRAFAAAHEKDDPNDPYYDFYNWLPAGSDVPAGRRFMPLGGTDILYECNFSDSMPELNFDLDAVRDELLKIGLFYLELGADGFRFDAAKYPYLGDHEKNAEFWGWYTGELKKANPAVYTVAEVWDSDSVTDRYAPSVNCFRFTFSQAEGRIAKTAKKGNVNIMTAATQAYLDNLRSINPDAMQIPFLANHDTDRAAGFLSVSGGAMAMAANLYLLQPGSPFIYYGEEIGLRGSRGSAATDANRRLAMRWGDGDTVADPEGSDYANQTEDTVVSMEAQDSSLLKHYRKVIAVRKANPEIARGAYTALAFEDGKAGGFLCAWQGRTVAVMHNATTKEAVLDLSAATELSFIEISAVLEAQPGKGGAKLEGNILTLGPQTSAVLR